MLIALGRGDKYRLAHIRESLEIGKELYISDQEFLQDLVKTHLKDRIYQARIVSISDKPDLFCENCDSTISVDEKFCTNCGTQKPEPSTSPTVDVSEPTPEPKTELVAPPKPKKKSKQQELEEYESKYLRRQEQRPSSKPAETRQTSSSCSNCGASLKPEAKFCGKCGTPRS